MMAAGISKNHEVLRFLLEQNKALIDKQDQVGNIHSFLQSFSYMAMFRWD